MSLSLLIPPSSTYRDSMFLRSSSTQTYNRIIKSYKNKKNPNKLTRTRTRNQRVKIHFSISLSRPISLSPLYSSKTKTKQVNSSCRKIACLNCPRWLWRRRRNQLQMAEEVGVSSRSRFETLAVEETPHRVPPRLRFHRLLLLHLPISITITITTTIIISLAITGLMVMDRVKIKTRLLLLRYRLWLSRFCLRNADWSLIRRRNSIFLVSFVRISSESEP